MHGTPVGRLNPVIQFGPKSTKGWRVVSISSLSSPRTASTDLGFKRNLMPPPLRNLSGEVRKIIPVKFDDCGDLPPTLGFLCWEDFSNQPYGVALKRVLASIFERDVRPLLGQPRPTSIATTT